MSFTNILSFSVRVLLETDFLNCFNTYSIPRFVLKFEGLYWNEHENGAIILYTHLRMLVMFTSHNGKSRTIFLRGALPCS